MRRTDGESMVLRRTILILTDIASTRVDWQTAETDVDGKLDQCFALEDGLPPRRVTAKTCSAEIKILRSSSVCTKICWAINS